MEPTYVYLLLTFLLFFIYFIVISLFGNLIFIIFNTDYLNKKLTLKRLLKSFAIGLSFHLIYGTIIISLRIFNFFTIFLPFIICDISLMIYIYYKKSNSIKEYFRMFNKRNFILFFKEKCSYIFIFFIVFLMLYILQMYFINNTFAYPGNDAYFWFENIVFVHKYGYLDYNSILSYPPGIVIYYSSIISPINDYQFFYFFLKYFPLFFSIINLLVLFVLSKDIFKKKIYIYFTLIMYLSFKFLISRSTKSIPSLLATSLGFLFLLFLGKGSSNDIDLKISSMRVFLNSGIKNKKILFKGFLLAGIFLANPLYGLIFMVFYFFYEFFTFFVRYNSRFVSFKPRLLLLRNFFFAIFLIFIVFAVSISPYIIGTSLNRKAFILGSYFSYVSDPKSIQSLSLNMSSLGSAFKDLGEWLIFESLYRYVDLFIRFIFARTHILSFYKETILVGIFLIFFGLFLNFKKSYKLNEKQNTLVNFIKFTCFLTLIIFYFCQFFVYYFNIPFISNIINLFYTKLRLRLFELFAGYWAIIFVLTFTIITNKIKKKYLKLKRYQVHPKKNSRLFKISLCSLIIFTSSFFYFANFENIDYPTYFNDNQVQAVLYMGNYFNDNPLEDNTTILLEELEYTYVYGLIVDLNLEKEYYNFTINTNYTEFNNELNLLNCEYVFLNISKLNESFKADFTLNFNNINEWTDGYIFSKVK